MATRVYNAKAVVTLIAGAPLTNVAKGDFLTVGYDEDFVTELVGSDGEVAVSVTNNTMGFWKIKLMNTSEGNDILLAAYLAFRSAKTFFPVITKDLNGRSLHTGGLCWIKKAPDKVYSLEPQMIEWTVKTGQMIHGPAGNTIAGTGVPFV